MIALYTLKRHLVYTCFGLLLLALPAGAQLLEEATLMLERNDLENAKIAIDKAMADTVNKKNVRALLLKAAIYQALADSPDEQQMSQGDDYPLVVYHALKSAYLIDTSKAKKVELNNSLLVNAMDMFKGGVQYYNLGMSTHDPYLLERCVIYFNSFTHIYQMLGNDTKPLDKILQASGYSAQKIRFMRAQSLDKLGNKEKAMKEYRQLQEERYMDPALYIAIYHNLKKEDKPNKPGMYAVLDEGAKIFPFDLDLQLTYAQLMVENKNYDDALQLLQKLRRIHKDNVRVIVAQALTYAQKGDFTKADSFLKAVYKIDPTDTFVLTSYAQYFSIRAAYPQNSAAERKEYQTKAYKLLAKAEELAPNNLQIKDLLAEMEARVPELKK